MLTMSICGTLEQMISVSTMASAPRLLAYTTRSYFCAVSARNSRTCAACDSSSRVSICAIAENCTGDILVTERTITSDDLRRGYVPTPRKPNIGTCQGAAWDMPCGYNA